MPSMMLPKLQNHASGRAV